MMLIWGVRGIDGLSVFISHGKKDDVVPVGNAERIRDYYQGKVWEVIYCLADTGHRLGKDCAKGLDKFLAK